ncbi:adenosine (5')-pentaphospho-(5'')-adenosine pyrophosphohydrolase [Ralstonia phage PQ43W]
MPHAAGILFVHDGRVLLLKRSPQAEDAPGTWGFPGGGIEAGETPEQAARRETREECAFDYGGPLLPLYTSDGGFQCYGALAVDQFKPQLNDEHTAYEWAAFDALPQPLHPSTIKELTNMPLIQGKSDAARSENIKREVEAGKPPAQAAAISYRIQREARDSLVALHKIAQDCMGVK